MSVEAYINFNGNCREAVTFYSEVFETDKPEIMLYKDVPIDEDFPVTEATKNFVLHTTLNIKGSTVMFSDVPPDMPFTVGNNISLVVNSGDMEELKTMFNKLKVEGTVEMELQETFWSKCYGSVIDKYGVTWQVNFEECKL